MKKLTLISVLILTSCAQPAPIPPPPPLTDQQIKTSSDRGLCSRLGEKKVYDTILTRKIDCNPAALNCKEKGFKPGSKKFVQCREDIQTVYDTERLKQTNPAFGYCLNSGFKAGSGPMATCMASYNQQQMDQYAIRRQADLIERQQDADANYRRSQEWDALRQQNTNLLLNSMSRPAPVQINPIRNPTTTNCRNDGYGGISCTSY